MGKPDILEVRDISLFQPGQTIDFRGDSFTTGNIPISTNIYAQIAGDKAFDFDQHELGFTVIQNRLVIERAQTLHVRGFFDSNAIVKGVEFGSTVYFTMILPTQNMIFETSRKVDDEDIHETDPIERSYTQTDRWKMLNSTVESYFCTPGDQTELEQLLAELRFSFKIQKPSLTRPHTRRLLFNFRP